MAATRRNPPPATLMQGGGYPDNGSTTPPTGDISAALLELLRKINAEVPTRPPLTGNALKAVQNYRAIAARLRTLSDPAPTSSLSSSSSTRSV